VSRPGWHTTLGGDGRAWVARSVGPGWRVVRVRRLGGGIAMATDAVRLAHPDGTSAEVVLRRWLRPGWRDEEPMLTPDHEAVILETVARSGIPVPRVLAVDPDGTASGSPAILLTRMPGRPTRWDRPPAGWMLRALGDTLAAIQRLDDDMRALAVPFAPYASLEDVAPPPGSLRPGLWSRAIDAVRGAPPSATGRFLHRDFHPGNVLWLPGRLSAVLDWAGASWGPPAADLAHLRVNLGADWSIREADAARDAFTAAGGDTTGGDWWDVRIVLDWLPDLAPEHGTGEGLEQLERYLEMVLARLEG
jgi:aminoglycoside phosphotransferase (APT) family kinase protein